MKLTAIVALLVIALVQPQVIEGQRPETLLIVRVETGWFNRQVDAYVEVQIGSTTQTTRTVPASSDPVWNQGLSFTNPTSSFMIVKVWNRAKRDVRGDNELMGVCATQVEAGALNRPYRCDIRDGFVNINYSC